MLLTTPYGHAPQFLGLDGIARAGNRLALGDAASDAAAAGNTITAIAQLQQALAALAKVKQKPAIDPGPIGAPGGVVPDQTMNALAAAISSISPNDMPAWLKVALGVALAFGSTTSTAKQFVTNNATELTRAVQATTAAAAARAAGKTPAAPAAAPFFSPDSPWYKTWWGIGAIAVGALGVLALLTARKAALPAPAAPAPSKAIAGRRR